MTAVRYSVAAAATQAGAAALLAAATVVSRHADVQTTDASLLPLVLTIATAAAAGYTCDECSVIGDVMRGSTAGKRQVFVHVYLTFCFYV